MEERVTDLPFKISDTSIVIVRALPVLQCRQCDETELENVAMAAALVAFLRQRGSVGGAGSRSIRRLIQDIQSVLLHHILYAIGARARVLWARMPTIRLFQPMLDSDHEGSTAGDRNYRARGRRLCGLVPGI